MRVMHFMVNFLRRFNYPFLTPQKKDAEFRIQLSEWFPTRGVEKRPCRSGCCRGKSRRRKPAVGVSTRTLLGAGLANGLALRLRMASCILFRGLNKGLVHVQTGECVPYSTAPNHEISEPIL